LVALINEQKVFFRIARRNPPKFSKFGGAFSIHAAIRRFSKTCAPPEKKQKKRSRRMILNCSEPLET